MHSTSDDDEGLAAFLCTCPVLTTNATHMLRCLMGLHTAAGLQGVFVVHNKDKPKLGSLPEELLKNHYYNCQNVPDNWIVVSAPASTSRQLFTL